MARNYRHLKRNAKVFDRWWPFRYGVIVKRLKTVLHIQWMDTGEVVRYDTPHMQFLEILTR